MPNTKRRKRGVQAGREGEIRKLRRSVEGCNTQLAEVKQQVQAIRAELDHLRAKMRG